MFQTTSCKVLDLPRAPGCQWLPWDCHGLPGKNCRAVILVVRKNWRMVRGRIQHISSLVCFFTCCFWQSQKKTNLFLLIAMSTPKKKNTPMKFFQSRFSIAESWKPGHNGRRVGFPGWTPEKGAAGCFPGYHTSVHPYPRAAVHTVVFSTTNERHIFSGWGNKKRAL